MVNLKISHTQLIHDKMDNGWVTMSQMIDKEYHGCLVLYMDTVPGGHTIDLKLSKSSHTRLLRTETNNRRVTVNKRTFPLS